jgi:hypothetical protein
MSQPRHGVERLDQLSVSAPKRPGSGTNIIIANIRRGVYARGVTVTPHAREGLTLERAMRQKGTALSP